MGPPEQKFLMSPLTENYLKNAIETTFKQIFL